MAQSTRETTDTQASAVRKAIRSLRIELHLNQRDFGRRILVQQNTVSRYELGTLNPSPQVLFILCGIADNHTDEKSVFLQALQKHGAVFPGQGNAAAEGGGIPNV